MHIVSRKLTRDERHRQYWPMFERWHAVAVLPTGEVGKATGINRRGAESAAAQKAHAVAKAKRTIRTTTR